MTIIRTILLLVFTSSILLLNSCKPDPNPEPSDPCEGAKLPSANFMLAEKTYNEERFFETNKINHVRKLYMQGPEGYDEYLWQLGTNLNWSTEKNAVASFSQPEGLLRVRLIAKRKPLTECFPNDDGIDTVDKIIEVVEGSGTTKWISPIIGYWEGTSTQFEDTTYIIRFYTIDSSNNGNQSGVLNFYLANILKNGCTTSNHLDFPGYIVWKGAGRRSNCTFDYLAYTFPNNKDSIIVEYTEEGPGPDYERKSYIFKGRRK